MALTITAVSGYKAVGRNMTGVTFGKDTIALDNGIRLDTLQMYEDTAKDLLKIPKQELVKLDVIPEENRLRNVRAQVISHGHLDHIGAVGINKPTQPIFTTHYASEIGRREFKQGDFTSLDFGERRRISKRFTVELVPVTHSIPHSSIVVLHTPEGKVVYASDYKFDDNSRIAKTDYKRLRQLGREKVVALIAESTRVSAEGKTASEACVRTQLRDILNSIEEGLIVATTFSTHIERVQEIFEQVEKTGRKLLIIGRSLSNQVELAERFGFLDMPFDAKIVCKEKDVKAEFTKMRSREKFFLLVTGHQGEANSALMRLADGKFGFRFRKDDSVLFCAATIPTLTNKANRHVLESKLRGQGVRLFKDIHVSGHASKEDHRQLIRMVKPEHIIPCHGGIHMRADYAVLASEEGYELGKTVHLINNGQQITI